MSFAASPAIQGNSIHDFSTSRCMSTVHQNAPDSTTQVGTSAALCSDRPQDLYTFLSTTANPTLMGTPTHLMPLPSNTRPSASQQDSSGTHCPVSLLTEDHEQAPREKHRCLRAIVDIFVLGVIYLNLWLGIALYVLFFREPASYTYSSWQAIDATEASKVSPSCPASYEKRRDLIHVSCIVWIVFSTVQGTGIALAFKFINPEYGCLILSCAMATVGATLVLIAFQIYLVRQWMLSACDNTPLNSLEAKMNHGFLGTQIVTVLIAWYIFSVWSRPFRTLRDKTIKQMPNRWMSDRTSMFTEAGTSKNHAHIFR
eukprot:Blabericola_migrator_1__12272@NODE_766_length_6600_cov_283_938313_g513_i2_p2_GENE_NODE_766_length_6600_cov_283_938313_g513_i2NODE_766_length_6600_cov_283_938313_g513_i2_p2_ORF_typecomplete_len314_score28_58Oxidored_q3/PF00499_20/2_3e03Oxidored_q3/PF00499_20/0_1DUF2070/PF09843_9/0_2Wzy_C/PF04932_15/1_2e03Wzy_C/PF04932_15/0_34_NODE_766_length_6600_cov_283_938313_g513_i222853226